MRLSAFAILAAALALVTPASAQYPTRPISLVVGFAAGGSTDVLARIIANSLTSRLGQNVLVDNKPGGSANIATAFVARAAPDGYTLMMATPVHVINTSLYRSLPFSFETSFTPIGLVASSPSVLLVGGNESEKDAQSLIAELRRVPGKFSFASPGPGSTAHLTAELFIKTIGADLVHVPYRGEGQAIIDVSAGRVKMMFGFYSAAVSQVQSGQLRPLAVTSAKRLPELPDVPTLKELGIDIEVVAWYGLVAPAGTPADIVARLASDLKDSAPERNKKLSDLGLSAEALSPEAFATFIRHETFKWRNAVALSGVNIE